jgi:hypothetical protein
MNLGLTKLDLRGISTALALCMLLSGFSIVSRLCVMPGPDHSQLRLDTCTPVRTLNVAATVTIARSASSLRERAPCTRDAIARQPRIKIKSLNFAPDPPPPKAAV